MEDVRKFFLRPPLKLFEDLFETAAKAVDHQAQVEHIVQGAQRGR